MGLIDPPPPPSAESEEEVEEEGEEMGKKEEEDYFHSLCGIAKGFGLISKEKAKKILGSVHPPLKDPEGVALDEVMGEASQTRLGVMGLDKVGLDRWARMSMSLHEMISGWSVEGEVEGMDIFTVAGGVGGLAIGGGEDDEDGEGELDRWRELVEGDGEECRFWGRGGGGIEVGGVRPQTGREVIGPLAVESFWKVLGEAMKMRGL